MSWIYSEPKIQSSRPNHSCCRRPKHSCHLNPPLSQPPSPAPESHCSQADFDPVFNDMDNATAGRPCGRSCGRDPTNMMQSTRRRRRAAPVRGGGTECKKEDGTRTGWTCWCRVCSCHSANHADTGYTRPDNIRFSLWTGGRELDFLPSCASDRYVRILPLVLHLRLV